MDISIRNILFPTDFSDAATSAKEYAMSLAERFDATLHLMHVVPLPMPSPRPAAPWINMENEMRLRTQMADQKLDRELPPKWAQTHRVVHTSVMDFEVQAILNYVKSCNIDLIVMGTHSRRGLSHFLLGSVAEKVVRMATCPVLTVHPQQHQAVLEDTPSHRAVPLF